MFEAGNFKIGVQIDHHTLTVNIASAWIRQKHCCFVYFHRSMHFGLLFVQVMDTVAVKPLSPFTYKRKSQQSVFMQLWFTPKLTRTVTKFKVINAYIILI